MSTAISTKAEGTQEENIMSSMEEGSSASPSRIFALHHCCSNHAATLAQKVSDTTQVYK